LQFVLVAIDFLSVPIMAGNQIGALASILVDMNGTTIMRKQIRNADATGMLQILKDAIKSVNQAANIFGPNNGRIFA
jgi:hypothetical protein